MARLTESVNPDVKPAPDNIKEKHFYRKHGANAYYGQNWFVAVICGISAGLRGAHAKVLAKNEKKNKVRNIKILF